MEDADKIIAENRRLDLVFMLMTTAKHMRKSAKLLAAHADAYKSTAVSLLDAADVIDEWSAVFNCPLPNSKKRGV
jgi:hypothetical protein